MVANAPSAGAGPRWDDSATSRPTGSSSAPTAAGLALILSDEPSEDVIDAVWALVSPEVFTYLTEGRGWSIEKTEAWLVEMGTAALGPQGRPRRGRSGGGVS